MSGIAHATISNRRKFAPILEIEAIRRSGARKDPGSRDWRKDQTLLERLEAENRQLRNQAIQLALQIQVLRGVGTCEKKSASSRVPKRTSFPPASREAKRVGISAAASRRLDSSQASG
jgi:hypothetical protein